MPLRKIKEALHYFDQGRRGANDQPMDTVEKENTMRSVQLKYVLAEAIVLAVAACGSMCHRSYHDLQS